MDAVLAINNQGYIGKDNKLMWHSKDDMKHFKKLTKHHYCVVGATTFLNMPVLPNRTFLVFGRQFNSKEVILSCVDEIEANGKKVFLIGGKKTYEEFLPYCEKLHLSIISDDNQIGDCKQPNLEQFKGKIQTYYFKTSTKTK